MFRSSHRTVNNTLHKKITVVLMPMFRSSHRKRDSNTGVSCKFCEIFLNISVFEKDGENFFTKHIICHICSVQLMFAVTADVSSFHHPFFNGFLFFQKPILSINSILFYR